ncbi:hypothetical protein HBI56_003970 [Parastagonospora nodorum]|nr:hypothetical protein HBH53_092170 [Parastagonospora nodorum]KAH3982700.1 hypothetical protein HBH51_035910 [Parastagonospora nodorum]KAH4041773.1 hypothetical protein HBI09_004310 [Parastagonospora nodorum]KAH4111506.1 hypothetical protein HBH46_003960 [Parastagonospora nodorum]KAH4165996.1 hypothetical protein HBH43_135150 [Parastagonospora nodorum]
MATPKQRPEPISTPAHSVDCMTRNTPSADIKVLELAFFHADCQLSSQSRAQAYTSNSSIFPRVHHGAFS